MRGLCGWFGGGAHAGSLDNMLSSGSIEATLSESRSVRGAAAAVYGQEARPRIIEVDTLLLVVAGHAHLRSAASSDDDLVALALALRGDPRRALSLVGGDFALAAWDSSSQRGLLAIDRVGVHQLVYTCAQAVLVFGSALDLLGGYPGMRRELSPQALYDYLYYHVSPGPGTVFAGQYRVPPGHFVEFDNGRVSEPIAYWKLSFGERADLPLSDLKHEFRELLSSAVRETSEGVSSGAFLSGGTDSSTVSGMLARRGPARTFSIGFEVAGYDEMQYARTAARHFGCEHHEYYVTPADVVDAVPRIAAHYDQPFGNASAVPTYYCARLARQHGVTRLLAGDGGDELFGGNERYAKQHLLAQYWKLPTALRRAVLEPLLLAHTPLDRVAPLRKLRSYVEQARPPMPRRYDSYNLLMHLGDGNVFESEFLASIDTDHPHRLMTDAHGPFREASLVNQMLAIDMRFVLADGDLPKVTRMCELAEVDVAFPMLDERLLAFSQQLSANLKLRGTQLRWFFKEALRDFLPPAVIAKKKHGFGLPVGAWLVGHAPLRELAANSIGLLRERGIVRPRFIDELTERKLREHPAYFGTMVWILMMLGLWLDSRRL